MERNTESGKKEEAVSILYVILCGHERARPTGPWECETHRGVRDPAHNCGHECETHRTVRVRGPQGHESVRPTRGV